MTEPPASKPSLDQEEETIEEGKTDRLLTLSDGIFAIAITLLVLEIKVPPVADDTTVTLLQALKLLWTRWPSFLAYLIGFSTIGITWHNHCVLFRYIKRSDHLLGILNANLLMVISFMPFVTALLADWLTHSQGHQQAAVLVYSGVSLYMAVAFNALWNYAAKDYHLLDRTIDPRHFEHVTKRYRFGPLLYLVSTLFALFSMPLCLGILAGLALLYAIPYGREMHIIRERLSRYK